MKKYDRNELLNFIEQKGIVRSKEVEALGYPRIYLTRLLRQGFLQHPARGLYCLSDMEWTFDFQLAVTASIIPNGVITLLSALQYYQLGVEQSPQIWVAVHQKARVVKNTDLPLKVVYFSGKAFEEGVEIHQIKGVPVKIYNPAKTIADCFKFRNKIGLDTALEALRECRKKKLCTMDELWHYAKICRVSRVIRPYLESLQ
ncbi:MAG: transcriptional regulator [Calditrichaeota bacterium]|nr:transcriptional regulator [Calditrichota bacterium]